MQELLFLIREHAVDVWVRVFFRRISGGGEGGFYFMFYFFPIVSLAIFPLTRKFFRRREILGKKLGRGDRFRPKIVEIGAILAIFEPFEVRNFRMPFFGEFS